MKSKSLNFPQQFYTFFIKRQPSQKFQFNLRHQHNFPSQITYRFYQPQSVPSPLLSSVSVVSATQSSPAMISYWTSLIQTSEKLFFTFWVIYDLNFYDTKIFIALSECKMFCLARRKLFYVFVCFILVYKEFSF